MIIVDNDSLAEYWKDVSPILKKQAREKRDNCFDSRLKYAIKQFEENNIPYKLCNEDIGHFNLYKDKKVVISFWSYTGKCYIPSTGFSETIGIKNCVKKYVKMFGSDNKVPTSDELLKEIKNILNNPNNHFEDGCDCLKIEELLEKSDK